MRYSSAKQEILVLNGPNTHLTAGVVHRNRFFIWIAVVMLIVIGLGFGKSFYLRPVFTDKPLPGYLIAHGVIMTAWYLLFLVQTILVNITCRDLHRKLGIVGIVLAIGVVVSGTIVHLYRIPRNIALGFISSSEDLSSAIGQVLEGISSLIPFAILIILAALMRRKAATHKRLMFWAMVWTIGPALTDTRPLGHLLDSLVVPYLPYFPADLFWLAALLAYDWKALRNIHPATYITFLALVFWYFVITEWIVGNNTLQEWLRVYLQTSV